MKGFRKERVFVNEIGEVAKMYLRILEKSE